MGSPSRDVGGRAIRFPFPGQLLWTALYPKGCCCPVKSTHHTGLCLPSPTGLPTGLSSALLGYKSFPYPS